jgi:hypothetical protein
MTRQHIKAKLTDNLNEYKGDPQSGSSHQLDDYIDNAANYIANETQCFYAVFPGNLVANQSLYSTPFYWGVGGMGLRECTAMSVYDINGNRRTIYPFSAPEWDDKSPTWRDQPAGNCPTSWTLLGLNDLVFYPAPRRILSRGIWESGQVVGG